MSRIVFVLLAVLAVFSADSSGQKCGSDEVYNSCGTACPRTCDNPEPQDNCPTNECVSRCECRIGYLRNDDDICVLPHNCPRPLREHNACFK